MYDFLLVHCSNFCRITHRLREFDVKQFNDLEISPRSSTFVSPESMGLDFLLAISVSVDVSYIISEILDLGG